ncbi:MAG: MerR family transcriptional regulator [Gammaproteobacteria bacterium]|nr:MerR family transcriptional regulator [Gammaproteobacteria bacterium]
MYNRNTREQAVYPIRVVAEKTGVNPVTMRAWERRYGLIKPERTAKGHRLYSTQDIDTINQILQLLEQGIPISRVAESLSGGPLREPLPDPAGYDDAAEKNAWESYVRRMVTAVSAFDERALDAAYNDALSLYPIDLVTRMLITPLLREMTARWETFVYADAERHFLDSYLRNKLGARFHHQSLQANGAKLVLAGVAGDHTEIPMFFLALAALTAGYRVVLLGANCQLESLEHVLSRTRAAALVLHSELLLPARMITSQLSALAGRAPCPVFITGSCTESQSDELDRAGLIPLPEDFISALQLVRDSLS